jgi:glycosyltransferase involved in cell wall biosynthesis
MEYMACRKPVIASFNTGHKDILTEKNSYPVHNMNDFKIFDNKKQLVSDWSEPDLDEIISKLEYAYHNRDAIKTIGEQAGEDMKKFTWSNTADNLLKIIYA